MPSNYGVNVVTGVKASRPIAVNSKTPIFIMGAVVTATLSKAVSDALKANDKILHYSNIDLAYEAFKDSTGTIRGALDGIQDQGVNCPIIVCSATISEPQSKKEAEKFYEVATIKSDIIKGIKKAPTAMAIYGVKSNLIIAPRFSHDKDVYKQLEITATSLSGTGIVDLNATDEADATVKIKDFGTRRLLVTDPYVKVWDTKQDKEITEPMSPRVAGMIAHTDGLREYGWADSASNRVMQGISGTARPIHFIAGEECEADRLRTLGIATVINYKGLRLWGFGTTDIDSVWQSLERVRVFDRVAEAVMEGVFWAIDRRADTLLYAKDSVDGLLLSLKGANVLVGYDIYWHPTKNTKEALTDGKFYLVVEMQNMPTVRRLEIECNFTDKFSPILMKIIGG
jgi:hypothetical protein